MTTKKKTLQDLQSSNSVYRLLRKSYFKNKDRLNLMIGVHALGLNYVKTLNELSEKEYKAFLDLVFKKISERIIDGKIFKLPRKKGYLMVRNKGRAINVKATIQRGEKVYYPNVHSDGCSFEYKWYCYQKYDGKRMIRFQNQGIYKFSSSDKFKRALWAEIMKRSEDPYSKTYSAPKRLPFAF